MGVMISIITDAGQSGQRRSPEPSSPLGNGHPTGMDPMAHETPAIKISDDH